jgi:hypothetical protein
VVPLLNTAVGSVYVYVALVAAKLWLLLKLLAAYLSELFGTFW